MRDIDMDTLTITGGGNRLTALTGGTQLFDHRPEMPLVSAIEKQTEFRSFHGNLRECGTHETAHSLTTVSWDGVTAVFRGNGYTVTVRAEALPGGVRLFFSSDCKADAWRFVLPPEHGVYGSGERYSALDLTGGTVPNLVTEHITAKTLVQKTFLPHALYKEKGNDFIGSYVPMPVYVTAGKKLIKFDCSYSGRAEFSDAASTFTFDGLPRSLTVVQYDSFPDISRALAGGNRQYIPNWCRGGMIVGVQGGSERVAKIVDKMLSAGVRLSAIWCQDWCGQNITPMGSQVRWNYRADETLYPDFAGLIARLQKKGVRFLAYLNPYLLRNSPQYNECAEKGWLITRTDGSIYHIRSTTFDAGMLDLTNPSVCDYVRDTLIRDNMLKMGISGWMCDFGEYLPMDCVLHDGDPALLHNQWPVLWARLNREAVDAWGDPDVFFFARAGYPGSADYVPVFWNGDQHTDLSRDYGMPSVVPASLSLGLSGIPLVHSDIGGFFSFMRIRRGREVLLRWMEMNALSPLMRSHESLRPGKNAQPYDENILPYTAALTGLHTALAPYLNAVIAEAADGLPAMRPAFYHSGDTDAPRDEYAYLLGQDLFVCPVIQKHAQTRDVLLPAGDWVRLGTTQGYAGGGRYTVPAPPGTPTAFYRRGSTFEELFRKIGGLKVWDSVK